MIINTNNNENIDIFICRKFKFSASHILSGCSKKCNNLHGHNYILKVTIGGQVNTFGIIENLSYISDLITSNIVEKLDHTHLNNIIDINTSTENIALWIYNKINNIITEDKNISNTTYISMLELEETDKNSAIIKNKLKK